MTANQATNCIQTFKMKVVLVQVLGILTTATSTRSVTVRGYSIIRSGFTVNLGSDSLGKSNGFRSVGVSSVSRIHFRFGFIVNPDPDPVIE